jgi:hypothetical protein
LEKRDGIREESRIQFDEEKRKSGELFFYF